MRNRSRGGDRGGGDSSSRSRDSGGYDDRRGGGGRRDDRRGGGSSFWSNDRRGGDRRDDRRDEGRRDTRSSGGGNSRWKDFDKPVSSRRRGGRGGGASNGWSGSDRTDKRLEKQLFESEHVTAGINFDKYDDIPIETSGDNVPDPVDKFTEEQLTKGLYENTLRANFKRPTPVQKYSIPIGALGRDLMACAQTGSGKTGGFLFPVIAQMLKTGPKKADDLEDAGSKSASQSYYRRRRVYPNALILAPTRELAIQIYDQARKFCYATGVAPAVVYVVFEREARESHFHSSNLTFILQISLSFFKSHFHSSNLTFILQISLSFFKSHFHSSNLTFILQISLSFFKSHFHSSNLTFILQISLSFFKSHFHSSLTREYSKSNT